MWVRFAETAASQMPTTQWQPAKAIELLKLKLLCSAHGFASSCALASVDTLQRKASTVGLAD